MKQVTFDEEKQKWAWCMLFEPPTSKYEKVAHKFGYLSKDLSTAFVLERIHWGPK